MQKQHFGLQNGGTSQNAYVVQLKIPQMYFYNLRDVFSFFLCIAVFWLEIFVMPFWLCIVVFLPSQNPYDVRSLSLPEQLEPQKNVRS